MISTSPLLSEYRPMEGEPNYFGIFGRLLTLLEFSEAAELLQRNPINVLMVGTLASGSGGYYPNDLYEATAYLEGNGIDIHSLHISEYTSGTMPHISRTKRFNVHWKDLEQYPGMKRSFRLAWERYHEHIKIDAPELSEDWDVVETRIPPSLEARLRAGDFIGQAGDIVNASLPKDYYDLIICRHVLYQVGDIGQRIAMKKFFDALVKGGVLYLGTGGYVDGREPDLGQWFDTENHGLSFDFLDRMSDLLKRTVLIKN